MSGMLGSSTLACSGKRWLGEGREGRDARCVLEALAGHMLGSSGRGRGSPGVPMPAVTRVTQGCNNQLTSCCAA